MIPKSAVAVFGSDHAPNKREAKRRKAHCPNQSPRIADKFTRTCATHRLRGCALSFKSAPAFRRFTAAFATGCHTDGSAPEPGFLKAAAAKCFARTPRRRLELST